jgi:hypothetical protein
LLAPSPGNKNRKPQTMVLAGVQKPLFDKTPGNNMVFVKKTAKKVQKHLEIMV